MNLASEAWPGSALSLAVYCFVSWTVVADYIILGWVFPYILMLKSTVNPHFEADIKKKKSSLGACLCVNYYYCTYRGTPVGTVVHILVTFVTPVSPE